MSSRQDKTHSPDAGPRPADSRKVKTSKPTARTSSHPIAAQKNAMLIAPVVVPKARPSFTDVVFTRDDDASAANIGEEHKPNAKDDKKTTTPSIVPVPEPCQCARCQRWYRYNKRISLWREILRDVESAPPSVLPRPYPAARLRTDSSSVYKSKGSKSETKDMNSNPYDVLYLSHSCTDLELKARFLHLKDMIVPEKLGDLQKAYRIILAQRRAESVRAFRELLDDNEWEDVQELPRTVRFGDEVDTLIKHVSAEEAAAEGRGEEEIYKVKTGKTTQPQNSRQSPKRIAPWLTSKSKHIPKTHLEKVAREMACKMPALQNGLKSSQPYTVKNVAMTVMGTICNSDDNKEIQISVSTD